MDHLPLPVRHLGHRGVQRLQHADLQDGQPPGTHPAPRRFPAGGGGGGMDFPPDTVPKLPAAAARPAARGRHLPGAAAGLRRPAHRQHPGHREDQRGGPLGKALRHPLPAVRVRQDGRHHRHGLATVPRTDRAGRRPEGFQVHHVGGGRDLRPHPAGELLHRRAAVWRSIPDDVRRAHPGTQVADLGRQPGGGGGPVRQLPVHHAERHAGENPPGPPLHHREEPPGQLHQQRQSAADSWARGRATRCSATS